MKLTRSIPVKDEAGKAHTISAYTSSTRIPTFDNPAAEIDGLGELRFNGLVVNDLGDGRYQVVDTGQILIRSEHQ